MTSLIPPDGTNPWSAAFLALWEVAHNDDGTLLNVGPGATGPIGSTTVTPVITIDAKGRVTALTSATIAGGGSSTNKLATFGQPGVLATGTGVTRFIFPMAATITSVTLACNTAPTGASIKVDVNKNGTTIFTTQANRPAVAISGFSSSAAVPDVTSLSIGDYLTCDIDQVGSSIAGSDLIIQVLYTA